ncbi:MAG: N-acetyl-gamma-glutamyl-phosphate reductase [Pseudomonadota bacterium]
MIKVGIVGATGYTGIELIRILDAHPAVEIHVVTSDSERDKAIAEVFPVFSHLEDLKFSAHDTDALLACEIIFFATPHTIAMSLVPRLLDGGRRIIDLSADFRLKDPDIWKEWYGVEHSCPDLLNNAVYGLTELNREAIKNADLVANPGCYPTSIALALIPSLKHGLIVPNSIVADAKSGVSGAGRKAVLGGLHAEVSESFKAYAVAGHRHLPEIQQTLNLCTDLETTITFVPHLVPMNRGILSTIYVQCLDTDTDWQKIYEQFYDAEHFVQILSTGIMPETRQVRGSNYCQIGIQPNVQSTSTIVIVSAIDNLVKGAAGQAVQNMNLMLGIEESMGLLTSALVP